MDIKAIPIIVERVAGEPDHPAPLSAGVPFPRGALRDASTLSLADAGGAAAPTQAQCLAKWPDGSCRWVLVDFDISLKAGSKAQMLLSVGKASPLPEHPVHTTESEAGVSFTNGIIKLHVTKGAAGASIITADSRTSAEIVQVLEIGAGDKRITSRTVIDSFDVYASGPLRGAVSLYGRRIYSDGMEGPWSERLEIFSGSHYVRVEDTFVYAHFPGTHAAPQNPLSLWRVEARLTGKSATLHVEPLVPNEESDGLVISDDGVAFWGVDVPLDLSRHTDEELIGEDTPGIALGLAKSCALAIGLVAKGLTLTRLKRPSRDLRAHTTPRVYAESGVFGDFAAAEPGEFEAAEEGLRQFYGFWLWYQDNDPDGSFGKGPWHGLLDWGDWQTRFADRDHNPTGWNYYEGRYGWDCNEMDTTLMLWSAFAHTGRSEYWRAAVAMSRHMMDVDMINVDYRKYSLPDYVYDPHSYGAPWKEGQDRMMKMNTVGLGRRHNVQHWGNGVGDTRHTWNGGIMTYYYMTGNRRAYDAVRAMADMHVQRMWGYAAGEYTLSLWCLYNAWQMTGDAKYRDELNYRIGVVYKLCLHDGSLPEHLDFDSESVMLEEDTKHGAYRDLTLDYISNALIDYYADTCDVKSREILLGLAELNVRDTPEHGPADFVYIDSMRVLAWAYKETGDNRFLDRAAYHLSSFDAKPLSKWPSSPEEWKQTFDFLRPHDWDIRSGGPGARMAPYVMKALLDARKADRKR